MGETKKIVVEHYPVEKLPEDLRSGIESGKMVRVTVETEAQENSPQLSLSAFFGAGKGCYSEEEAISFIRRLRDE